MRRPSIDEVVSDYVTLRTAGGGSLKGLCPFHDEKSPSFNVNPARGFWHCFGCGEGGDVFAFLMKIDGLGFSEAVERLADKYGVTLRREEGDVRQDRPRGPQRARLIEAHRVAQEFYADALGYARRAGRRGSSSGSAASTRRGRAVRRRLRARATARRCCVTCGRSGFTDEETVAAGLVAIGRSAYDRFRGRLLWPIRESSGDTIGFGARRIFDDDRIEAKYLNTPETPIYKKSQVLYGIDLARREIGALVAGGRGRGLHRRDGLPPRPASAPRSPPAVRRSATTTRGCCAASSTTTRSSAAR